MAARTAVKTTGTTGKGWKKPAPVYKDYLTTTRANGQAWRANPERPITLAEARRIAYDMHAAQTDKVGRPYREHLSAVEQGVVVLGGSTEERIAALFHDAVEDHHTTYDRLEALGVTADSLTIIEAVSKRPNEEQGKYLARIVKAGAGACRVKVADLLHNTRHDRLAGITDEYTRTRLLKKYRPALASLLLALELLTDEDGQKKLATKPIGTAGGYSSGFSSGYGGGSTWKSEYPVRQLMVGDWPTASPAPIVKVHHRDGESALTLANGEEFTTPWREKGKRSDKRVEVRSNWRSSATPPEGVGAEDLSDFKAAVDKAKGWKK